MVDKNKIEKLTYEFLIAIGESPEREGLKDTPKRVAKACEELFGGLDNKEPNLIKEFYEPKVYNEIVEVNDIPVFSVCEHHIMPFFGKASIKYKPKNKCVLGLSKFARIVDHFSKKPQIQEKLTAEIADYIWENLSPFGVEVTLECTHTCMTGRGVKSRESTTRTTIKRGDI